MIGRRNKKSKTEVAAKEIHDPTEVMDTETYIAHVEAQEQEVAHDEVGQMAQELINENQPVEQPKDETPVVKEESKPKKKGIRYAPLAILADPKAVIVSVAPNPKRPNTESFDLYARFMVPSVGLTIAEYEANFAANHRQGRHRARRLLRWDYAHGFVKLEAPVEQEAPAPEAPQEPEAPAAE
jgi:hypothetical protein